MTLPVLVLIALATSVVSGILGMAGGLALMGACTLLLPVADAMIFHGTTQVVANGWRAATLRRHVRWRIVGAHACGSVAAWLLLHAARMRPDPAVVLLALGLVPFLALALPRSRWLDASRAPSAALCGLLTTGMQLMAGVAGPLLDVFYVDTELGRREVVATKAATQVIAHASKIAFYAPLLSASTELQPGWLACGGVAAILGTSLGTRVLERWSDAAFRSTSRWVVLGLGATFLARGVVALAG